MPADGLTPASPRAGYISAKMPAITASRQSSADGDMRFGDARFSACREKFGTPTRCRRRLAEARYADERD